MLCINIFFKYDFFTSRTSSQFLIWLIKIIFCKLCIIFNLNMNGTTSLHKEKQLMDSTLQIRVIKSIKTFSDEKWNDIFPLLYFLSPNFHNQCSSDFLVHPCMFDEASEWAKKQLQRRNNFLQRFSLYKCNWLCDIIF